MPKKPAITSSELGILWITYQEKTMVIQMLEYFIAKSDDDKSNKIMVDLYKKLNNYVEKVKEIFEDEGAVIPLGYTSKDVNTEAPKLYNNGFDILFVRLLKKISMGLHTLNLNMAYREDIIILLKDLTATCQAAYNDCTKYLIEKGLIARPPYTTMPNSIDFITDKNYLGGLNPLTKIRKKRTLNTVEVAYMYHMIETNNVGLQMVTGFAQSAKQQDIRNFFSNGAELSKSIIKEISETFLEDSIQVPSSSGGHATRSTIPPFSDKLMMYCTSIFCDFAMGGNSLGTAFSRRYDLAAKMMTFAKDIYEYANEGAKLMIKNGWMEEPPQMEERGNLKP
ncbi:MAG TPA: DUF3231 family protein [Pseudogracilibacillus sp.]|nr:DUF3231 family protein [Pseudogracilibacillus sp.]